MSFASGRVLIVIPCLNEEAHLPDLLTAFAPADDSALLVIADGGSTDRSREIVSAAARENPRVVLLDNPARIQSAGVNLAAARFGSGREWLVRVDAHAGYPPSYVDGLSAAADAQGADSVVVPLVSRGIGCFQRAAAQAQNSALGTGGSPHRHLGQGRWIEHGHHALMRLSLFCRVGGYREDMPANEDAELDRRFGQAGGRIWLEPALAVTYYPRRSAGSLWRQYAAYGCGRARNFALHRSRPKLRQLAPLAVLAMLVPVPLALVHWVFAVPALAWGALCLAGGAWIGRGKRCAMLAGIPAMIMHVAWSIGFIRGALTPLTGAGPPPIPYKGA